MTLPSRSEQETIVQRLAGLSPERRALLTQLLSNQSAQPRSSPIPRRDGAVSECPLSYPQQRLWFLQQLSPGSHLYNIHSARTVKEAVDHAALERSVAALVERHEILRTTFPAREGRPVQVVGAAGPIAVPVVDLEPLPAAARPAAAARGAAADARQPFDLARGPLLRLTLVRLAPTDHLLLLTLHHLICDGWSMGVLFRELGALYDAALTGHPAALAPLPIQYADYAMWQREARDEARATAQLAYWQRQLAGVPSLALPTDHPRPAVQSFAGAAATVRWSAALTQRLTALARAEGVTLFMVLVAGLQVLLARYTGQEDVAIGTPVAGRTRAELEGLIGCFVNTLVLRTDLTGDPTVRALLARVRAVTLDAFAHQDVPFEKLLEVLNPARDPSRTPLFQVMLQLQQNLPASSLPTEDTESSILDVDKGTSAFDMALDLWDSESGLEGRLEYSTDLFDGTTITRMLGHLERLLTAMAEDSDAPLSRLPMLTGAERHQVLVDWNQTDVPTPPNAAVHTLFEAQAAERPEAVAVVAGDERLTYAALNARANALAHELRLRRVGPRGAVAVCQRRSVEWPISLLGILKAGAAYVPLDPSHPSERLITAVRDSGAQIVLVDTALREAFSELPASIHLHCTVSAWSDPELSVRAVAAPSPCDPTPDLLAYIVYTSGTTGRPKGVAIPHSALTNHALAICRRYALRKDDRVLQFASPGFDVSAEEMFPTWACGGTVVLRPERPVSDIGSFLRDIDAAGITVLNIPTPFWHEWVRALTTERLTWPASLRLVIIGSDRASPESLAIWRQYGVGDLQLLNAYGSAETTITSLVADLTAHAGEHGLTAVPIGRPIRNTQAYILDRHLEPVPIGVIGELHIGGAGLAREYLNDPQASAQKFIAHPFRREPHARLFKTGDLARYRADGNIEYLGRVDDQVKIRGTRVEPAEVESALRQHPAIRQVAVTVRQEGGAEQRLAAYFVPASPVDLTELRRFLKTRLPEPYIPSAFVALDELPHLPNGKLDRAALSRLRVEPSDSSAESAPRTEVERVLATIWSTLLGRSGVGIHDNFFELGGDSILSFQVIARARQVGLTLTATELFQYQTIAELASAAGRTPARLAEQGAVTGVIPLTPIQSWFFEQDFGDPEHFNQAVLLEPAERLDADILARALQQLVDHHDALRLRFAREGSVVHQANAARDDRPVLSIIDFAGTPPETRPKAIEAAAAALQAQLNLATGPLIRAGLFDLGEAEPQRLLIAIHHLAVDGVSWRILLEDLASACQQLAHGANAELPPKTTSFKRWAERLEEYAGSEEVQSEIDYWRSLPWARVRRLPVDYPGGANTTASSQTLDTSLSVDTTRALLEEVPAAFHTRMDDVLLTALGRSIGAWTGSPILLADLEGHGRDLGFDDVDLSRTVGWFTSVFPVLLDLDDGGSTARMLQRVRTQLRHVPHKGTGFGLLRYLCADPTTRNRFERIPQAEISFNYLGQFDSVVSDRLFFRRASEQAGPLRSPRQHRTHLIEVDSLISGGRLIVSWTYSTGLFARATIESFAERFLDAIGEAVKDSRDAVSATADYSVSEFPLAKLSQQQLDRLTGRIGKSM